jgi:hypothetical protein
MPDHALGAYMSNDTSRKPTIRTVAIVLAAVIAAGTPIIQALTGTLSVGQSDLVTSGDATLRAAAYAFSIWGLIYGALLAFAVYQALPATQESPSLRRLGWPSVVAMLGCSAWLVATTYDARLATVAIIVVSAAVLCVPLARRYPVQHRIDFWLICAPVSMLAGWLTVASAINTLTVLTGFGVIDAVSAPAWAAAGVALVAIIGLWLTSVSRNWVYPLPIAWGLVAVGVAEQADRPLVALMAVISAVGLVGMAIWVSTHRSLLLPLPRQQ